MRTVSVQLDDAKYDALEALAKQAGLSAPGELLAKQIDAVLESGPDETTNPTVARHLQVVIEEDRGLLDRLAK